MGGKSVESRGSASGRMAGVLLHPTSFPSKYGIGDLGKAAYQFIDFLVEAGQRIWQVLPLGPTSFGDSPYQSFSSFAGQPLLISPDLLLEEKLLVEEDFVGMPDWDNSIVDYGTVITYKTVLLKKAYDAFTVTSNHQLEKEYQDFCEENREWLDDYALFMAGKEAHDGHSWLAWEDSLRNPTMEEKQEWEYQLRTSIRYYKFIQFLFFRQWFRLKEYANQKGVFIVGDIPIFVALDSADVWANKGMFQLDSRGYPIVVAGVPPDYFSETGQLWGNPLYDWEVMKQDNYRWWIQRVKAQLKLVDFLRIDHFRGFEAYWAVPYEEKTAIRGEWKKGPFKDLFYAIEKELGKDIPIFAEDLGIITPEVEELRDTFRFPGMKILQFAFDNTEENNFLPHYYSDNCICYTGTHDNDTTIGWYKNASGASKEKCKKYMNIQGEDFSEIVWGFIRMAYGSTAKYAVIPLQDLLEKDSKSRMNIPSTPSGNWAYRYEERELTKELADKMRGMVWLYGR